MKLFIGKRSCGKAAAAAWETLDDSTRTSWITRGFTIEEHDVKVGDPYPFEWSCSKCNDCGGKKAEKAKNTANKSEIRVDRELLLLELRNAIADKEWYITAANAENSNDGWPCDLSKDFNAAELVVRSLIEKIKQNPVTS